MQLRDLLISAAWAAALSVSISLLGAKASMGLAHGPVFVIVLFIPGLAAFEACNQICSEPVAYSVALFAQFLAYFAVVIVVRGLFRRRRSSAT